MIKNQMDLALSVDTATLKATIDAYSQTDEKINAYSVGFIPWEMVEESTLFQWSMYHFEKTGSAGEISPASWPYDSGVVSSVDRGVPFCYVLGTTVNVPARYVYKDVVLNDWLVRGTLEQDGYMAFSSAHNGYDIALFQGEKYIIHTMDLQNIVSNVRNANFNSYIAIAISVFNDDYSKAGIAVCTGAQYDPIADTISNINVTVMDTTNSNTFSYAFNSEKFKQIGKTGFTEDVTTGGYTYHIFAYIVGIHQYCVVDGHYLSAFIADGLPFRVSATYGYIDINTNLSPYAVLSDTPQPQVTSNDGRYASIGLSRVQWNETINADRWANVISDSIPNDSFTFTDGQSQVSENGNMRLLSSIRLDYWFKSYTYTDVKISALTCTPIIKQGVKYYCPEYDENYALTGSWVEYSNQNINPDINDFDPADIPEPTPGDDSADSGGDNILPYDFVNTPLSAANNFTTLYALTTDQVSKFGAIMWASLSDDNFWHAVGVTFTNDFSINPADMMRYFVFLRYYPFDLSDVSSSYSYGIYIGRSTYPIQFPTGTAYPRRVLRNLYQIDGGEVIVSLPAQYDSDDFYTMDPCTQVQAHIPYCGRVQLPASEVYGKKLKLQYVVDLQTGAIQAIISVESDSQYIIATLAGTCGASVQITANNNIEFLTRIATVATGGISEAGTMATQGAKIAGEEGAAAGAVLGALTGTVSALAGLPPVTVHSQGNTTGFANYGGDKQAYVTVVTVKRSIPQSFAKSCGYVSNKQAKIGDLKGYTEMINPDLSGVSAHEDELNEIYNILQTGFYA